MTKPFLTTAQIHWNDDGVPFSDTFDDLYFSKNDGLAETRYVFLEQNNIVQRLHAHPYPSFVIGETGFGTGLNFLATWQLFRAQRENQHCPRLHFISVEKYPLEKLQLEQSLQTWPELRELAVELCEQYPPPLPCCHRLVFDQGRVMLDLWFGEACECFASMANRDKGLIDCWFLDGFAPAKNPEMWQPKLFDHMAVLSRKDATCATFTAAGFVRRGLSDAGFTMRKIKGFGNKREMLTGKLATLRAFDNLPHHYARPASNTESFTLIGAGLAAASLALALTRRGRQVTLLCQDKTAAKGASGNRQGALYPLLNGDHDRLSHFFATAFGFSRRLISELATRHPIAHDWCGVAQLGYDDKSSRKLEKIQARAFPADLVQTLTPTAMQEYCNIPLHEGGICYPQGGWVNPKQLVDAMLAEAHATGRLHTHYQTRVTALDFDAKQWQLTLADNNHLQAKAVIIAAGADCTVFPALRDLPLSAVRGQVSHVTTQTPINDLRRVLCYRGYMTPAYQQIHCIGASFVRQPQHLELSPEETAQNKQRLIDSCPMLSWPQDLNFDPLSGRVALRCISRDHLPLVGCVSDYPRFYAKIQHDLSKRDPCYYPELYLIAGLGSRGICSAPLISEMLASQLCEEPLPLDRDTLNEIAVNRASLRRVLRGAPLNKPCAP